MSQSKADQFYFLVWSHWMRYNVHRVVRARKYRMCVENMSVFWRNINNDDQSFPVEVGTIDRPACSHDLVSHSWKLFSRNRDKVTVVEARRFCHSSPTFWMCVCVTERLPDVASSHWGQLMTSVLDLKRTSVTWLEVLYLHSLSGSEILTLRQKVASYVCVQDHCKIWFSKLWLRVHPRMAWILLSFVPSAFVVQVRLRNA